MSDFPNQVERVIRDGYNFNFGDNISHGFDIAKKAVVMFAGFIIIFAIINSVFNYLQVQLGIVGYAVSLFFSIVISPNLIAGFYYTARKVDENQDFDFGDFFKGFDWVGKLATIAGIQTVAYILFLLPLFFLNYVNFGDLITGVNIEIAPEEFLNDGVLILLVFIPLVYFSIAWMFAPFLVIFYDMESWPAMEASRKIVSRKWFLIFAFLFVVGLIAILGVLGLIIGLLFTVPAALCMVYAAFRDIVGMPEDGEDDILDHLIEEV